MQKIDFNHYKTSQERTEAAKKNPDAPKLFIETFGCQMNFADSETVASVMIDNGFVLTEDYQTADVVFINTCSVRDNAELRIRNRLSIYRFIKKTKPGLIVGILGCMAERLKEQLLEQEKVVDIVAGPDSYRSLPQLVREARQGESAINVLLSREETYADISPIRLDKNRVSAYISITRGCDNMCAFCVVPFTRGRERSREPETIIREVHEIIAEGYKEIMLLGQNVDKYNWNEQVNFAQLLKMVAEVDSRVRIRFATSYPQDFTDEVLQEMANHKNICKYIHLPVQHGSNRMLDKMHRGYNRQWYLDRIAAIRRIIPDCGISTDLIAGYCTETEEDHLQTLSLMEEVKFDYSFMFFYSERPKTYAARNYPDDVPDEVKKRRLNEIIELQNRISLESNHRDMNKTFEVLVEGESKKSPDRFSGRNSQNKTVVFPRRNAKIGDIVEVVITECTSATLLGHIVSDKDIISKIN
jgi:tRNA-2-methylthio-N6-dimethylallyladenosine synthase